MRARVYPHKPTYKTVERTQREKDPICEYMDSLWDKINISVGRGEIDGFAGSRAISESTQASCHSVKSQCASTPSEIGLHSLLCVYEFVKADFIPLLL